MKLEHKKDPSIINMAGPDHDWLVRQDLHIP